jgi:RND family efflux transporter MFP subunit
VVEDPLKLQTAVPERFAAQVRVGQPVDLSVESLPGLKIVGQVVRVNPTVDTSSRTFQIEVAVPNADRSIKPGSFATASILVDGDAVAVTVPEEAIVRFAGVTKLFAVSDTSATAVPVETGTRLEVRDAAGKMHHWVEIVGAVEPGMRIVTTGHSQLANGSTIRIREQSSMATDDVRSANQAPSAAPRKDVR